MNKIKFISVVCVAIIAIPALAVAQSAPAAGGSVSSAVVSTAPSTDGSVSSATSGPAPSTGSSASSASSGSAPSTGDSSSSAGSGSAPSTGGCVSSGGPATPAPTPASVTTGGGSSGSSGSFYGGSSYGGYAIVPVGSCPLITSYMNLGGANDKAQVTRLQAFLKDTEGYDVDVNGSFDQKTEAAVIAFQNKYMSDIMGPWGATKASGAVYLTTLKKINQIACNIPLNLTPAELSIINAYKQAEASGETAAGTIGANQNANNGVAVGPSIPANASSSNVTSGNPNVAAAGQASIFNRFWNFLKSLF